MRTIDFYKYTANGNNFVLIDELDGEIIPEKEKSIFSKYISNQATGIGCDSLIVLQKFSADVLQQLPVNQTSSNGLDDNSPEYIMRVYEEGVESNMCGNGLVCLAHHLSRKYAVNNAIVATEIPTKNMVPRTVKANINNYFQALLGRAKIPSNDFLNLKMIVNRPVSVVSCLLQPVVMSVIIKGVLCDIFFDECYLTFTGEPHLVIFRPTISNMNRSLDEIFNILFENTREVEKQKASAALLNAIGNQFNALLEVFPKGINVNFAEILEDNKIAVRCFERGINLETYACGTGATAVAVMANELGISTAKQIIILPWRAGFEELYRDNRIIVNNDHGYYQLATQSTFVSKGEYYYSL